MELMGPMIVMNWRMKPICHRLGLCTSVGSTLSPGTATCDVSYRKLFNRIWVGNMGRNGRNSDAAAMLNMLPKLELVLMMMYFMMLAKHRRPSRSEERRV